MKTTVGRHYHFESAHFLPHVGPQHRCRNMHGHNYKVDVYVQGELDARGFVLDFFDLDAVMAPLLAKVDHKVLNEVEGLENPTAELIAAWFLERLPMACRVRVYETDTCWADVER